MAHWPEAGKISGWLQACVACDSHWQGMLPWQVKRAACVLACNCVVQIIRGHFKLLRNQILETVQVRTRVQPAGRMHRWAALAAMRQARMRMRMRMGDEKV